MIAMIVSLLSLYVILLYTSNRKLPRLKTVTAEKFFIITDPGIDSDDALNAALLAMLQRQGKINIIGAIANYYPALQRACLLKGIFKSLKEFVPVAIGTDCNSFHSVVDYEFNFPLADEREVIIDPWFIQGRLKTPEKQQRSCVFRALDRG